MRIDRRALTMTVAWSLAAACVGKPPTAPSPNPLLRLAEREKSKVWLFGFASAKDESWLTTKVAAALDVSDDLWVETPPQSGPASTPGSVSPVVQELGYDRSRNLLDVLPPDLAKRTLARAEKLGITPERLAPMRPWLAREAIQRASAASMNEANAQAAPMVYADAVITTRMKAKGVPIHSEYATFDDVIRSFATMSDQAQIEYLQNLLDYFDGDTSGANEDTYSWIYGHPSDRLILEQKSKTPALYAAMHATRNQWWAKRIDMLLSAGGAHFVLVGGNHVLGPDSIQACCARIGVKLRVV